MHVMYIDLCGCTSTGQTGDTHHCVNVPQRHATVHKHKVKMGLIQIKMSCQAQQVCIFIYCICILDGIQVLLLVNVEHRSNQTCTSLGGTQL